MSDEVVVVYREMSEHWTRTRPLTVEQAEKTRQHFLNLGFSANITTVAELAATEEPKVTATGKPLVPGASVVGNGQSRGLEMKDIPPKGFNGPLTPDTGKGPVKVKERRQPTLTYNEFQMLKLIAKQPEGLLWVAKTKNYTPGFRHGRHSGGERLYNRASGLARFGYVRANKPHEHHVFWERGIKLLPAGEKRLDWEKTQPRRTKPKPRKRDWPKPRKRD